jgi:hypothetical protein
MGFLYKSINESKLYQGICNSKKKYKDFSLQGVPPAANYHDLLECGLKGQLRRQKIMIF